LQTFNDNPAELDAGQVDLAKYLKLLWRHKAGIIALTVLGTIFGALLVYSKTPYYIATSQLVIESQMPKLPSVEQMLGIGAQEGREYMHTQYEIIKSRSIAELVATKLGLYELDDDPTDISEVIAGSDDSSLTDWLKATFPVYQQETRQVKSSLERRRADAAAALMGGLQVSPVGQTNIVNISYVSDDPVMAAKVANTFAKVFIENQMDSRMEMTRNGSEWLFDRMNVLKQNLAVAEKKLQRYIDRHKLIVIGGDVSQMAEDKFTSATADLAQARAVFAKVSRRYGRKHPDYIAALAAVNSAAQRVREAKAEMRSIRRNASELSELRAQVDSDRAIYEVFLKRVKATDKSLGLNKAQARILNRALPPAHPFAPNVRQSVTAYAIGSFMLAILLVLLSDFLNRTIKSTSDVEEKLGQVTLGVLPTLPSLKKGGNKRFPILDEANASFAESLRTIRTGIILSGLDNPHKVILVTSSVPGEGKTTVATNLAVSLAQMEHTLLIGADLRRPTLHASCGIDKGGMGLAELVAGNTEFKDCIDIDEETGLHILSGGATPPNPLEILFSVRFAKALKTLENFYDRIVIDSPPVDAVSDALVLSKFAKTVVYVVEADRTSVAAVKHGLKRLAQYDAPLAGIVLNKVDVTRSEEYHGYYDRYGYST